MGALKTIQNNIETIFDDDVVQRVTFLAKRMFWINYDYYERYKNDIVELTDIGVLNNFFIKKWIKQILKDKKIIRVLSRRMAEKSIERDKLNKKDLAEVKSSINKIFSAVETYKYLELEMDIYMSGGTMLNVRSNVNAGVWGSVLGAMLFSVPEEKILECKNSILENYYLPSVYTDRNSLFIKFNEHTTLKDLYSIRKKIQKEQEKYKKNHQYINGDKECPNRKIDRKIMDFYDQGLKPAEISHKLNDNKYTPKRISERIKEVKKRTRRDKKLYWFEWGVQKLKNNFFQKLKRNS